MGLVDGRLGTKIVLLVSPPPLKLGTPDQNFMLRVKLLIRVQINRTLGNSHSQVIVKNGVISPLTKIRPPLAALPQNFISPIDREPFETLTHQVLRFFSEQFFMNF